MPVGNPASPQLSRIESMTETRPIRFMQYSSCKRIICMTSAITTQLNIYSTAGKLNVYVAIYFALGEVQSIVVMSVSLSVCLSARIIRQEGLAVTSIAWDVVVEMTLARNDNAR